MTPKQKLFCEEYLVDLNATQAAVRAGYSARTAHAIGQENLRKPIIADAVAAAQAERMERILLDADDVIAGLLREAQNYGQGASHSARVAAWTQLGKHVGLFRDDVNLNIKHAPADDSIAAMMKAIDGKAHFTSNRDPLRLNNSPVDEGEGDPVN